MTSETSAQHTLTPPPARRRYRQLACAILPAAGLMLLFNTLTAAATDKKEWKMAVNMYADKKARKIGDLLTIVVVEEAAASKDAKSASNNKSGISGSASIGHPRIDTRGTLWTNAVIPAWSLDASRTFEGGGSVENKDTLNAQITVRVTDVLPNGVLLVEGKRSMIIQDEAMEVVLTGMVRPRDIAHNNTVQSTAVADATIKYTSTGPIAKNQERGLISALWNWINPF